MVKYVKGDLLNSSCDYICHQVNCQGRMGSGIAKQIRERFPRVYQVYMNRYMQWCWDKSHVLLGTIDAVYDPEYNVNIINMYSQDKYGYDGQRYTSYDAFSDALYEIKKEVPSGYTIGFPKNIGCGFGGANWKIISTMIEDILGKDYDVYIYELEDA